MTQPCSRLVGQVANPRRELIANVDLARPGLAARRPVLVGDIAAMTSAEVHPVRAGRGEAVLSALVDLEIIREHGRAGPVDDVGEGYRVAEHLLRRAAEPERVGGDQRSVDGE